VRVRTYCFPGCFTRPPGHLDSQPPPRADHVEAKSPPGGNAQESVLDLDQLLVDATVPRSGATSLRDTTTTRTALSSLFAPAHCRKALVVHSAASNSHGAGARASASKGTAQSAPSAAVLGGRLRKPAPRGPRVPDLAATASNRTSARLRQRHTCSPPKASVDRIEQEPHNSLKPRLGFSLRPLRRVG
jgi:hypothetical protein